MKIVATASRYAADYFHRTPDLCVVGHIAIRISLVWGRGESVNRRGQDRPIAKVVEVGVEAPCPDVRVLAELIVHAAGEAISRAIVSIFAYIHGVIRREIGRVRAGRLTVAGIALDDRRGRLDIVDTPAVPVVAAAEEHAELLLRAETLADRAAELARRPPVENRRVTAKTEQRYGRLL